MSERDDNSTRQRLLLEELVAQYAMAVEQGSAPSVEDLVARHPELSGELRARLAAHEKTLEPGSTVNPHEKMMDAGATPAAAKRVDPLAATLPPDTAKSEPTMGGNRSVTRVPGQRAGAAASMQSALKQYGDYELLEEIARGGMGVVYKARQTKLNRIVALKMILSGQFASQDDIKRFYAEAEAAANLDHAGIVPIYEVGEREGQHYFSMGFIEGQSLAAKVADGPLSSPDAATLMQTVVRAVAYAHKQGVVHRDLKPANILLDANEQPRITDFGLAKRVEGDSGLTATGQILGTPAYMPPEQAAGKLDEVGPLSDVYSLGAVLYCLLTGRPPFQSANVIETLKQVLEREPVSPRLLNPSVDRDLETICLKCLDKQPSRRYNSAQELADELDRFLAGEPIRARRIGTAARAWRWCKRKPLAAALCASVLVLIAAVGVAAVMANNARQTKQLADLNSRLETGLDAPQLTQQYLEHMEFVIQQIEGHSPAQAREARRRLHEEFSDRIDAKIRQPKLEQQDIEAINAALALLEPRDAAAAERLRSELSERQGDWQTVFHLRAPYDDVADVFLPASVETRSNGLLHRGAPADSNDNQTLLAPTNVRSDGLVEFTAVFGERWQDNAELGVTLNAAGTRGYHFLLELETSARDEQQPAATTFAEQREQGGRVVAILLRNDAPLFRQEIPIKQLDPGPLRMRATRERGQLSLQINTLPPVQFRDPFPLSTRTPGHFAVRWPDGVALAELHARRKPRPPSASLLEQADDVFDRGEYSEALALYQEQAIKAADAEFQQEARYKHGQCLLELNRTNEAADVFQKLFIEGQGERWPPLAGCQLWAIRLQKKQTSEADAIYETLATRFSFEQLAVLIPGDLREEILGVYRDEFRYIDSLLKFNPQRLQNVERVAAVDRLLSRDGQGELFTQLEVSRAYRFVDRLHDALAVVERLAAVNEDATLARHYSRLLRLTGNPQRALEVVDQAFNTHGQRDNWKSVSLSIERARVYAALGEWEKCEDELDTIYRILRSDANPSTGVYTYAALMKGFLYERRRATPRAVALWKEAYLLTRQELARTNVATSEAINTLILGSLSGELTSEDVDTFISRVVDTGGGNSMIEVGRRMISSEAYTAVFQEMWRTPRGRALAEQFAFESITMRQRITLPLYLAAATYMRQTALRDSISAEQEQVLWDIAETLFDQLLAQGKINAAQVGQFALTWKGTTNVFGWAGVAPTLDADLRGRLAYLFAHRFIQRGDSGQAEQLFAVAIENAQGNAALAKLAQADLDMLKAGTGKLIVNANPGQTARIEVRQSGQLVTTVDLAGANEIELPAGDYEVATAATDDRLRLSSANVSIIVAGRRSVAIEELWNPGSDEGNLHGLIPRPTGLPGQGRWQVYFRHPEMRAEVIAWSPTDDRFAVGDQRGNVRIYDAESTSLLYVLDGHNGLIAGLAWHCDGAILASASWDRTVRLWDATTGAPLDALTGHTEAVTTVAWSADGLLLASGDRAGNIRIHSTMGKLAAAWTDPNSGVNALAWSPDGQQLASAVRDGVRIWNVQDRRETRVLPTGHALCVAWSPAGSRLAAGGEDRRVRVWNTSDWQLEKELAQHNNRIESLAWKPADPDVLASSAAYDHVFIWNLKAPPDDEPLALAMPTIRNVAWSRDGSRLATAKYEGPLATWTADGAQIATFGHWSSEPNTIDVSPDGSRIAVGCADGAVRFLDEAGNLIASSDKLHSRVLSVRWNPAGNRLAYSLANRSIRVVDASGELEATLLDGNNTEAASLTWNPGGANLAAAYADNKVRIWDVAGNKVITELGDGELGFTAVDWNSRGLLATGNTTGKVQLWNLESKSATATFDTEIAGRVIALGFNPAGDKLAVHCSDRTLKVIPIDGSSSKELSGSRGYTQSFAWHPDGKRLLTSADNGRIIIWRGDGTRIRELRGHYWRANAARWIAPDRIVSAGQDATLRFWDSDSGAALSVMALLPDGHAARFSAAGKLEYSSNGSLDELVYAIEGATGTLEFLAPSEFHQRTALPFNPPQERVFE